MIPMIEKIFLKNRERVEHGNFLIYFTEAGIKHFAETGLIEEFPDLQRLSGTAGRSKLLFSRRSLYINSKYNPYLKRVYLIKKSFCRFPLLQKLFLFFVYIVLFDFQNAVYQPSVH